MRTPLDAFHDALQGLVAQKRAEEWCPHGFPRAGRCRSCERTRSGGRRAAQGFVGERVIYRPPRRVGGEIPLPAYRSAVGEAGVIGDISRWSADVRLDNGSWLAKIPLTFLDAETVSEEEVDAAIASIRSLLEGGAA